jgi:hypothetical protein
VAGRAGTGESYAVQVSELWSGLARTLSQLETLAGDPARLEDRRHFDALKRLQYALHRASEDAYGLTPAHEEPVHVELAAALAGARDATGEIVEAIDEGGARAAEPLVYEWRGALFRVRLARLRLAGATPAEDAPDPMTRPPLRGPVASVLLLVCGLAAFVAGATIGPWPLWAAGMLVLCASFIAYRP